MDKQEILKRINYQSFYQSHISSLKLNGANQGLGLCPFHDDHNPSLSVNGESGLYRCFSCNASGDIFRFYEGLKQVDFPTALKEIGKMVNVTEVTNAIQKIVGIFEYRDEKGNVLYKKKRIEPGKDGRAKEFFFEHLEDGKWIKGRGSDPVLYRLHELIQSKYCFITEGEQKADLLASWELTATCLDSGANSRITGELIKVLSKVEKVVILPDNDRPGMDYALKIANALHGKVQELKVVKLPELPEKGDIVDWVKIEGNTKEKFIDVVKSTPVLTSDDLHGSTHVYTRETVKLASSLTESRDSASLATRETGITLVKLKLSTIKDILEYQNPEYLIESLLYKNTSNLITGYAGTGKSLICLSIAHAIITGQPLWGQFHVQTKGSVLIVDEENPHSFLKDRVVKMGFSVDAPLYFLHFQSLKIDNNELYSQLLHTIQELKPTLVIFDALIRLHNAKEKDNTEMAIVMGKIRDLINQTGTTSLTIHHDRKGQGDKKERARGAGDIVGAVDNQLCLEESKEDESLILSNGKCRTMPFKPIKLKIHSEDDRLAIDYLGRELTEAEVIVNETVEILKNSKKSMDVGEIKTALDNRDYSLGSNKLRTILKNATGKEISVDTGARNRKLYRLNPASQLHGCIGSLNCETENETIDLENFEIVGVE